MGRTNEQVVDALAAALVVADLSDVRQREGFAAELREVAKWAASDGDVVVAALAEEAETVISRLREGDLDAASATDELGELITCAVGACAAVQADSRVLDAAGNQYAADPSVVADFLAGASEQLDEAESLLSALATGATVDVSALFRCVHTLKGMSGFLSLDALASVSHAAESVLDSVRSEGREMSEDEVEQTLGAVDHMRRLVAAVGGEAFTPSSNEAVAGEPARKAKRPTRAAEQVRVNAARLEDLLDAMGELSVAEAELATALRASPDPVAVRSLERLQRIARDMQGTATALRMVSLKQTFAKMSRVVRDAIARSGKSAELVVSGEQTEIDRAIAEALGDPLVHLLRNAVDHGIEPAAERVRLGKPSVGRIGLRASHRSGSVCIEIEDDGRGIDTDLLVTTATRRGIAFDQDRPLSLIFQAGFSTAEAVTELSGRGVGLDAVSSAVASLRGQLDVASEPGVGTCVTIRLPLTLAIIEGIVVRAGAERYVLPTNFVERAASVTSSEIVSAAGTGQVLVLHDGPVPVAPITGTMGGTLDRGDVAVVLADGDARFALLVDEVVGRQSLVIKPLTGPTAEALGPAGAALMGDGKVALVVDPAGLAKAMRKGR